MADRSCTDPEVLNKKVENGGVNKGSANSNKKKLVGRFKTSHGKSLIMECVKDSNLSSIGSKEGVEDRDSFKEILELLTSSPRDSHDLPEKTQSFSQNHDLQLTSDLVPSVNSHSADKSGSAMTFEELLTNMLTPDLVSPERQNDYFLTKEHMRKLSQNADDSRKVENMTFEELIDAMLATDAELKISSSSDETDVDMSPQNKTITSGETVKNPHTKARTDLAESESEFTEMLSQIMTPSSEELQQTLSSTQRIVKEMSTQTSFDQGPTRIECCTTNELSFDHFKSRRIPKTQKLNRRKQRFLEADQNINILKLLSCDVTILSSGFSFFNNISKIGTSDWLQSAFTAVDQLAVPRKAEEVKMLEAENTFDMYADDLTKKVLKFAHKGAMKIYKISKSGVVCSISGSSDVDCEDNVRPDVRESTETERQLKLAIEEICKDKELIRAEFDVRVVDKEKIRTKIHDVFSKLYESFSKNQNPCLVIRKGTLKGCLFKDGRYRQKPLNEASLQTFKMRSKPSAYRFCRLLYLLGKIYSLLENNTKLTKREIFYQCKHLLKNQRTIDVSLEAVSRLLGLGFWHLNIVAHSGLVYGNVKLIWTSGETTNCNLPATAIPSDLEDLVEVRSTACFILIVEKQSIYHKLLEEDVPNKLGLPFILITGRGMPGFNTRLFVKTLSNMMSVPVFILVDADIYGIKIMLTYRFGSTTNCHLSDQLALPYSRWLGVFPSEITKYGMQQQNLSKMDRITINSILKYPMMDSYPRMKEEVKILSDCNKKASIEGLIKNNSFLSQTYLPIKFIKKDFI